MEKLSVNKFLVIEKVEFVVSRFNVIIGPQANGKSIIAKLLYFFKQIPDTQFREGISKNLTKRDINQNIIDEFVSIFPRYTWEGKDFEISYSLNDTVINIAGVRTKRGKTSITVNYSDDLFKFYIKLRNLYKRRMLDKDKEKREKKYMVRSRIEQSILAEYIFPIIYKSKFNCLFNSCIFIPASRSFFANLQKNIFTFLASNIDIDPFLKKFGQTYENAKFWYKDEYMLRENKKIVEKIYSSIEGIINGEYEYSKDQDWIKNKGGRINLANASSGQQESLPMLLALSVIPLFGRNEKGNLFFIEEPEAHLFPYSQKQIIDLLSLLYTEFNTNFFITTHSPYILSALNILFQAAEKIEKIHESDHKELNKLLENGCPIKFEDVSAYTIREGKLVDIKDKEFKIIGSSIIDEVSDVFDDTLNSILSMEV